MLQPYFANYINCAVEDMNMVSYYTDVHTLRHDIPQDYAGRYAKAW